MKKIVTTSLTAALMMGAVPAALAQAEELANQNPAVYAEVQSEDAAATTDETGTDTSANTDEQSSADKPSQTEDDTTTPSATAPDQSNITLTVQEAVQDAEKLSKLRQQLKDAPEVTEQVAATYKELVNALVDISDLPQAIEVQKELLKRTYQAGNTEPFQTLGQLYIKANVTGIKAFVNGVELTLDQAPFIVGGRALVTERVIREALNADVRWDETTGIVTVTRGDRTISLTVNKNVAVTNNNRLTTDAAPVVKNGSLYLPIRLISEQLEAKVDWQKDGQIIIIDDNADQAQPADSTAPDATDQTGEGTSGADNASDKDTTAPDNSTDGSDSDQSADQDSSDSDDSADGDSSSTDDAANTQ
ncbi:copper amine oxidase N-terminal domain-containing protein [Brevibacillus aydinogluensis]|uniref:Copper amine oxidase N-terminal domain-containing protein n=1 Tax=Brevibacillus aydinogluensis TaxID=927786 RepID=A0AA48RDB8_9BACL|nr:copper amine oxidase N-terminal domain-containing protein [Brevibacillus aydinogluensis]CAJ1003816.1 Copper amine oxidase N-terminal domain-containing protein [Brevibacillus aydinogluensis]